MILPLDHLLAFALAGLALNLTPGADVMFATASGLQGGPKAGVAAGLGVGLGGAVHVGLAALGLSAMLAALPGVLTAIRWAGAGYLVFLAWKSWNAGAPAASDGAASLRRAFTRGFLTNVLNPKVILFILAFLPQFTDPSFGPLAPQILLLGAIFTATGTLVTAGYGALAGRLRQGMARRMTFLNRLSAVVIGGLALKLVTE